MNMDHLKYLIEIGKSRTMVDAANRLYLTPQTLSMAIKKLENELDMQLVYRFPNGVKLSENGKWLAELSEQFFDNIEQRKREYRIFLTEELQPPTGKMTLAVQGVGISHNQFTHMLQDIYINYPQFEIMIDECCRHMIEESISSEQIEMGFIYRIKVGGKYDDRLANDLIFYPVQKGKLIFQIAPQFLKFGNKEEITPDHILKNKICSYVNDDSCKSRMRTTLELMANDSVDYIETNSFTQYQAYILSGKCIGVTVQMEDDRYCTNYIENCNMIQIEDDINIYFGILRKKDKALTNNTSFIFNEVLKNYHLSSKDLTKNVKDYIK